MHNVLISIPMKQRLGYFSLKLCAGYSLLIFASEFCIFLNIAKNSLMYESSPVYNGYEADSLVTNISEYGDEFMQGSD